MGDGEVSLRSINQYPINQQQGDTNLNPTTSKSRNNITAYGFMLTAFLAFGLPFQGQAAEPHFCYDDTQPCGPSYWGTLADEWKTCSIGQEQSPVNIVNAHESEELTPIKFNWKSTPLKIKNNGHTLQVNYAPGSSIRANGVTYQLLQFHFHAPSEHTINGNAADMEVHFVHVSDQGVLAVVGVMMRAGSADRVLEKILHYAPGEGVEVTVAGESVNANDFLPKGRDYFKYPGSLTTPPCTEGVRWHVLKNGVSVGTEQVTEFHHLFHGSTARPAQPLNNRKILRNDD